MTFDDMHKETCALLLNWRRNKTPPRCSSLSPPLAKASAGSPPAEAYLTEKSGHNPTLLFNPLRLTPYPNCKQVAPQRRSTLSPLQIRPKSDPDANRQLI